MRRLLLTGGAGFIGSHFVDHLLSGGLAERVVVLDSLTYAGSLANLESSLPDPRLRFVRGDICDGSLVESLLRDECLDGIVNFAAESSVDRSIGSPGDFVRTNVEGVFRLLEAARRVWCAGSGFEHRFHQVSTDEVFGPGAQGTGLRDETSPYAPCSPYAATKAAADHLLWAWRKTYGVRASISYSSNVYGPRQQADKFIPRAVSNLLVGADVPIYGDGMQRRSWIFVRDVCRALQTFLSPAAEGRRLYVGSELELSNLEVLRALAASCQFRAGSPVRFVADRPGHDRRYGLTSAAFRELTGFRESVGWVEGLVETVNWYRGRA